jgi:signal transduction histidine kinase
MNDQEKNPDQLSDDLLQLKREFAIYKATNPESPMWQYVIKHSPVSIQVLDKDGYSVMVNEAHNKFFEASPPPSYNLFTDKILLDQELDIYFDQLRQGKAVIFPETCYNPSLYDKTFPDKTIWLKTIGFPLIDQQKNPQGYIVIHENLTEQKKLEKALEQKHKELYETTQKLKDSREKERADISAEIHDELAQVLWNVKLGIGQIGEKITDPLLKSKADEVFWQVDATIDSVHRILTSLYDVKFEEYGIDRAIISYCHDFTKRSGIETETNIEAGLKLPHRVPLTLYKILREATTNIINYARATKVSVELYQKENKLYFSVSDNGIGITQQQIDSPLSLGIISMKDRIKLLDGKFEITSDEKSGTKLQMIIPLP